MREVVMQRGTVPLVGVSCGNLMWDTPDKAAIEPHNRYGYRGYPEEQPTCMWGLPPHFPFIESAFVLSSD